MERGARTVRASCSGAWKGGCLHGEGRAASHGPEGSKGCQLFEQALDDGNPFELITLDIEMPVMNGHEMLANIRAIEEKNGIMGLDGVKVVMRTSLDDPEHIFSAFREGCEAYVKKIDMEKKLVEEIKKLGIKTPQTV